ncbi:MAG: cytochrome b/b6 domain-containing protein [Actinobacteria bacterium]|nr:cytochrome b/b6 domain-containing protein [Actinomycetota bacterium]
MQEGLWFDNLTWLVFLAPFIGVFAAGFTKRQDPVVLGDKVLRHDRAARLEHWTHGIGTAILLVSGIIMGLRFTPSFVNSGATTGPNSVAWMNVHFAAVVVFLFGTFYYAANTIISQYRFAEHLPTENMIPYTVRHYGLLLGFKKFTMPPEDKYFESEKAAYIMALVATFGVIITGFIKVAAHMFDIPAAFMGAMTWVHDISTIIMLLFFLAHVFFAAIAPFSWKTFPSMITGYISKEHAKEEHGGWYARLTAQKTSDETNDEAVAADSSKA